MAESSTQERTDTGEGGGMPPAATPPIVRRAPGIAKLRDLALVPAIAVVMVIGYWINPVFLHKGNLVNILQTMSEVAILVLAETLIMIAGRMDLSLESTMGLAPGLAAWLIIGASGHGIGAVPAWAGIPITLGAGALIGGLNGLMIVRYKLNGFIVTLGMLITLRGLLTGISKGQTFFGLPPSMLYIGTHSWFTIPVSVWLCFACFGVAIFVLGYTRSGRSLYAIGGNIDAAKAAGIRTDRVLWWTLIIAGALAALGGLMLSGRLASVASSQGNGYIFRVFAAAVIGGISLNGGKGTMFGAFTGVLLLYLIQNVLQLAGVPTEWLDFVYGALILTALVISRVTSGKAQE